MGQILKRKKKGRPAKVDPGGRGLPHAARDIRRSLRRRNVKYVFDLDDYFDEDEVFADEEDQRQREKDLRLLLKLQSGESTPDRRYERAPARSASSSEDGREPSKKRKFDEEMDYENDEDNYNCEDDEEIRDSKPESKGEDSSPGTTASRMPMPEKKTLELILDKLQRKDIYGVYAEPVDPEELPDYHDVIDNPMDFATVRNKLRNESYPTFEQFESDVFLICSNAMRYNAPDTVYHKQARTIQELAKRKFHKVRLKADRTEKVIKPEQKPGSGSFQKKQIKRSVSQTVQEPVGSDFSSGATLATAGDIQNVPSSIDLLVDGNSIFNDKLEDSMPGKSRFGRRPFVEDENRRATYNISLSLCATSSESIFSTFDGEMNQLIPVGLYSDHSYAKSMARFAASLGSMTWKVASMRIEQALPQGFKFGQGWVGEYEPLPTPVLMLEDCRVIEPPFLTKPQPVSRPKHLDKIRPAGMDSIRGKISEMNPTLLPPRNNGYNATRKEGEQVCGETYNHQNLHSPVMSKNNGSLNNSGGPNGISDLAKPANYGLSDPVEMMRKLCQKPVDPNAAAARAWMSVGAAGLRPDKNQMYHSPRPQFRGEFSPIVVGNQVEYQKQLTATADLSRFQRKKQESLPPDLNIGFHSSSSGLADSQQPDLALQL